MSYASPFNLRVYGLLINNKHQVLLSDEYRMNTYMCKFPGGGLEFGEGTIDCLKREFKEELDINIEIKSHFYTTDYFQKAQFFEETQLISIYYLVGSNEVQSIKTVSEKFNFSAIEGQQAFRWADINKLSESELSFPIDKKVVQLLKSSNL